MNEYRRLQDVDVHINQIYLVAANKMCLVYGDYKINDNMRAKI